MLHVIVGANAVIRAEKRREVAGGPAEEIDVGEGIDSLAMRASTPTLTGDTATFFIRGAFSTSDAEEGYEEDRGDVLDIVDGLVDSPHTFIFEEEKLLAKPHARLEKAGAKLHILETSGKKKEEFNVFELANALARRDRKNLWLLLMKSFSQGIQPENIAGVLAWKARGMLASAKTPAERSSCGRMSRELVHMYHDSHRGAGDLGLLLERFALTL